MSAGFGLVNRIRLKKQLIFLILSILASAFGLGLFSKFEMNQLIKFVPYREELRTLLMNRLAIVKPFDDAIYKSTSRSETAIYVLGGSQDSLENKFKTASDLYHQGMAGKILILSRRGITHYSPLLKRNFTNDEWAVRRLVSHGVKEGDIELISIKEDFWGTFNEAKHISDVAIRRGYKNLILITSSYHTMRVWKSFSRFLQKHDIKLYIYMSDDPVGLRHLLPEYFKLLIYDNILL